MTDYKKASGDGEIMIRDTGTNIEFWAKPGYSSFYWDNMSWQSTINGNVDNHSYDWPSGSTAYRKIATRAMTVSGTVSWKLNEATGTSSFAGPTTLTVSINRDTVPAAPDPVTFSSVTNNSLVASFTDNSNGGDAIDSRQLAYRIGVNTGTLYSLSSDGSTAISGLTPGQKYFFYARVHNSLGWSGYSAVREVVMKNVPPAPGPVNFSNITQATVHAWFAGNGDGGSPVLEWRIGYGLTPAGPDGYLTGYDLWITNLQAGRLYYFWSQGRNAYGWGPLSVPTSVQLLSGGYIKVGLVWKRCVPYVKVGGVWKVVEPQAKLVGNWRKAI
jgi:hypothetical protein